MAAATADDVITLVYTSGTTGPPKGAMLTNANFEFALTTLVCLTQRFPDGKPPGPDDIAVTYLPLCHVAERIFSTWHLVGAGVVLNFAESIETVTTNLREVQPTLFFAVPRIWEKLHAGVLIKGNDASRFKRMMLNRGLRAAGKIGRAKVANGGTHTTSSRLRYAVLVPIGVPPAQGAHRTTPLPARRVRRRPDRARGARVLHGHRHPGLRALRDDREHRARHAELHLAG